MPVPSPTITLRAQNESGDTREIGVEHADFPRLGAQVSRPATCHTSRARLFGLLMIAIGVAGWWYNWHLAKTEGHFYIKLLLLGPLGVFGGLLMALRPEWAGPIRQDSTRAHKLSMFAVMGLMFVVSGIDFYMLNQPRPHSSRPSFAGISSNAASVAKSDTPDITFLGRTYRLGSFNAKQNAQWEFVTSDESVDNWQTLLTIVDRPDAHTRQDLDRLAEGIMTTYKSHNGQILLAKTMGVESGAVYNYMVAAFEEPGKQRYELNFVKMALGPKNATVAIYGVRISDPRDYRAKAREFLDRNSSEVGRALASVVLPDVTKLPRKALP